MRFLSYVSQLYGHRCEALHAGLADLCNYFFCHNLHMTVRVQEESCLFPQEKMLVKREISVPLYRYMPAPEDKPSFPANPKRLRVLPTRTQIQQQQRRISRS